MKHHESSSNPIPYNSLRDWLIVSVPLFVMANAANFVTAYGLYTTKGIWIGLVVAMSILLVVVIGMGVSLPWFRERFVWGACWYFAIHFCPIIPMGVILIVGEVSQRIDIPRGRSPEFDAFGRLLAAGQIHTLICLAIGQIVVRHFADTVESPLTPPPPA